MSVETMPLNELTTSAIRLLCREMGLVNTARFIQQFTVGYCDYTEERVQIIGDLTVDEIVAEIKASRRKSEEVGSGDQSVIFEADTVRTYAFRSD